MDRKAVYIDRTQKQIMQIAKVELLQGNRVTISPKRFGHSRKFDGECDIVTNSKPLRKPLGR